MLECKGIERRHAPPGAGQEENEMHMACDNSKLGEVLAPRVDVKGGAIAMALVAAVGGSLIALLAAVGSMTGASIPDVVRVVSAVLSIR
jgi:hypothetical protein